MAEQLNQKILKKLDAKNVDDRKLILIVMGFSIVASLFILTFDTGSDIFIRPIIVVFIIVEIISLLFAFRNILEPARIIVPAAGFIVVTLLIFMGGIHDDALGGYYFLLIFATLILGRKGLAIFGILNTIAIVIIGIAETSGVISTRFGPLTDPSTIYTSAFFMIASTLTLYYFIGRLSHMIEMSRSNEKKQIKANRDLNKLKNVLEQRVNDRTSELQAIFASIKDLVVVMNREGCFLKVFSTNSQMFNSSSNYMIGKTIYEVSPEEADRIVSHINTVLNSQKTLPFEFFVGFNSHKVWFEASVSPLNIDSVVWVARDITERKQLEEKMRLDSQILSNIFDSIVLYKVSDGKIVYTNPQFNKLFGYSSDELIGEHISILDAPAQRETDGISKKINESLLINGNWEGEIQDKKKDGSTFWCHVSVSGFTHDDFGEVWIAVQQDISDRKQAQLELTSLASHDSLTGLYNRAFFDEEMNRLEHGRQFPVSIVMADIDGLKTINDSKGHASGDLLLQRAANVLTKSFRGEDMVARIGGDEFAVLLPNADAKATDEVLKRLESNILENNKENDEILLSISYGASTAENGKELMDSLANADEIMYKDKKNK